MSEQDPHSWLTKWADTWPKLKRLNGSRRYLKTPHLTEYTNIINRLKESDLMKTNNTGSFDDISLKRLTFNRLNTTESSMWMIQPRPVSLLLPDNHHLSILDLHYRVIVHDFPVKQIPAVEQHVMNTLNLASRVPIPEIICYQYVICTL